ncbi:MAG TPA: flavin reductase [Afipia sp.]|jgi:flavin reductase (DIM6/NTAB) family NADH-FMN oxidoreductase RutF|nr:monooxygenase [Afipia sp.]OUX63035.1 MAG: hypothetical protein CBB64_01085 [Afipia sp. TMED4]HAO39698.1 flavin reductase [Afipia sp.]HAP09755.1 flavin reductase [Afipia sp.]HBF56227.1 flavin reductase [Afipia sp.]
MTAISMRSLSIELTRLLVSMNRASPTSLLIRVLGVFGANILNADRLDIAERVSGKGDQGRAPPGQRASGVPPLRGALAAIDCGGEDSVELLLPRHAIRQVLDVVSSPRAAALSHWQGNMPASTDVRTLARPPGVSDERCKQD